MKHYQLGYSELVRFSILNVKKKNRFVGEPTKAEVRLFIV